MQQADSIWVITFVIIAGALQAWGPPMNGALNKALVNPWLASLVSFLPIICLLFCLFLCSPLPLPNLNDIKTMPWWAPLGGVAGAFAVIGGLLYVHKIGAGTFAGLTITANIIMSLLIDKFGLFGMQPHELNTGRVIGGFFMIVGITLISMY
ncbi:DMT family transporter [Legionella saoudiensis]|uniref:DMT family transporter n=1 Tax=Legionella saoudiensis TaxID=1750561 RepID=UPI000730F085|nr:DMT family transporter [Legionella saoudiensis]